MNRSKEEILKHLRQQWEDILDEGILDEGDELDVDIELLTSDGNPGQPLAYDIIQRQGDETFTYTWVERPDAVEPLLGLADVTYDQAITTLHNLLLEAESTATSTTDEIRLTSVIKTDGVGMTYGRYHFADQEQSASSPSGHSQAASFPTNYQAYFTTNLLRTLQHQQSGVLFNQVTASLDSSHQISIRFGA